MKHETWKRIRRILSIALIIALCTNTAPEMVMQVKAAGAVNINTCTVEFTDIVVEGKATYTGSAIIPNFTVKDNDVVVDASNYTYAWSDNTKVSTETQKATLTITGTATEADDSGYYGTLTGSFEIVEANQKITLTSENTTITITNAAGNVTGDAPYSYYYYTGTDIEPIIKVTYKAEGSETAIDITNDCDVEYTGNKDASDGATAKIKITAKADSGYEGTVTANFGIKYHLTEDNTEITIDADADLTYDGNKKEPGISVTYNSSLLDAGNYDVTYGEMNTNAGTDAASVTITGKGDCVGSVTKNFSITAKDIATVTDLNIDSVDYSGQPYNVTDLVVKQTGNEFGTDNYTLSYEPGEGKTAIIQNAETYTLKIEGKGNYTGEATIGFTINAINLSRNDVTVTVSPTELFYTRSEQNCPEVTVKLGESITFEKDKDYTVSPSPSPITEKGSYALTIEAKSGGNLIGSVTVQNAFEVKNDSNITASAVTVEGAHVVKNDNGTTYYYKDASDVTIKAEDGYAILECNSYSNYSNGTVTLDARDASVVLRIQNTENYRINDVTIATFTRDTGKPVITATPDYSNNKYEDKGIIWDSVINAPQISVSDTVAGVAAVYCTTKEITNNNINDDIETLAEVNLTYNESESNWEGNVNWEANKTYYIIAVDNVGNRAFTSVTTPHLDNKKPTIEVKDGNKVIEKEGVIYLNANKAFTVTFTDNDSGINENQSTKVEAYEPNANAATEKTTITNTAVDNVNNSVTHTFYVIYDSNAPKITSFGIVKGTELVQKIETNQEVTMQVTVSEDKIGIDNEYQLAKLELLDSNNTVQGTISGEKLNQIPDADGKVTYTFTIDAEKFLSDTYKVIAYDNAGNKTDSSKMDSPVEAEVVIDKEAPSFTKTDISINRTVNENNWVNQDTTFTIVVKNGHNSPAEVTLQYSKDGKNWSDAISKDSNDEIADTYTFKITETDDTFNEDYYFIASDALGNAMAQPVSYHLQKDKVEPDNTSILVAYSVDGKVAGKEDFSAGNDKYVFAKEKIDITLYIKDEGSGVSFIEYQYGELKGEATAEKNDAATIDGEKYAIIHFTNPDEIFRVDNLKITRIEDMAGNVTTDEAGVALVTEGKDILIIDGTAPVFSAVYPKPDGNKNNAGVHYYAQTGDETYETVILTYTEAYYAQNVDANGNPQKPTVELYKNGSKVSDFDMEWSTFSNNQISATIKLPYGSEGNTSEIEYEIRSWYKDGSGNIMVAGDIDNFGSVTNADGYKSGNIILDNKAPELTAYAISGNKMGSSDNGIDVYQHKEDGDIVVTFTIADNDKYWDKNAVGFVIYNKTTGEKLAVNGGNEAVNWVTNGDSHAATYILTTCENPPAVYAVEISYADAAGNKQVNKGVTEGTLQNGIYTGRQFIVDEKAPVWNIIYNQAYRLVNANPDVINDKYNTVPEVDYIAYYNDEIVVTFTVEEDYANEVLASDGTLDGLVNFTIRNSYNGGKALPEIQWSKDGNQYTGVLTITEEGSYILNMTYQDAAANKVVAGNAVQGGVVDAGAYTSIILVLDKTAPVISAWFTNTAGEKIAPANTFNGRSYFAEDVYLNLQVTDENVRYEEFKQNLNTLTAFDSTNTPIIGTDAASKIAKIDGAQLANGGFTWQIPLTTEANYNVPMACEDLAGNKITYDTVYATVDKEDPAFTLSYSVTTSGFMDAINYRDLGFLFADSKMTVTATANDTVAGINYIIFKITDENGKETVKTGTFEPASGGTYQVIVPLDAADFKGTVEATVIDWSANKTVTTRGHVVESAGKHNHTGSIVLNTLTSPSRVVDGMEFYNSSVNVGLSVTDMYSGIRNLSYVAGSDVSGAVDFSAAARTELGTEPQANIVYEYAVGLTLDAGSNNANGVSVNASFTDNAGHSNSASKTYNIDPVAPTVTVTYDLNEPANELYYNATRTATVAITERNFSEKDVKFDITNTDGAMPVITGWSTSGTGDATVHTCSVIFAEDGDYTFTLSFQDMAGNVASYNRVDTFTIDKTVPEYTVTYDNNQSLNGYYYNAERTVTIDVFEHNFDPALINIEMTATRGESGVPSVSGWSNNGDHHVATIHFGADGDYTFTVSGMDMSTNPLADYAQDRFVIDTKAPEVEIFDIDDMSANNGVVMPGIRYSDINYDADNSVIDMKGYHNGNIEMNGTTTRIENGVEIKLNDFEHVQGMDDLYTMNATVYDLAGNSSEASVTFSVNRFGSVYTFDDATAALIGENGKYYTNEEQDIVITETNVDTLEFKEITCNLNGQLVTLAEGEDYTVEVSGSDASWKQYIYTLNKSNFTEEGTYLLTIYSEDRAANISDNSSKGMKIEFVVDKTNPSVLVSGVVDGEQYRENSREVTIDVQDNIRMAEVRINVNGMEQVYTAAQIAEANGKLVFTIDSANNWQSMKITAYDAAGNVQTIEEIQFLITSNIFVQFFMNKPLFFGTIAGVTVVGAGAVSIGFKKKKRIIIK